VFIDETWATTTMTRTHGRAPRGQRLVASVPHGHWKTSTFVAALRYDGITAPCVHINVDECCGPELFTGGAKLIDLPGANGKLDAALIFDALAEGTQGNVHCAQPAAVLDGAMNGEFFRAYVEQFLAPTLKAGDIVIMDNLSSHKIAGIEQAIAARGAQLLYLPPYSPDLNPIEPAFAKFKALLRKAAERTVDALWSRLETVLDAFTADDCRNFFRHAGYA
jgi:transposase